MMGPTAEEWSHLTRPERLKEARRLLKEALNAEMSKDTDPFSPNVVRALYCATQGFDDPFVPAPDTAEGLLREWAAVPLPSRCLKGEHHGISASTPGLSRLICASCGGDWPCLTRRTLDFLGRGKPDAGPD